MESSPPFAGRSSPQRDSEVILSLIASGLVSLPAWRGDVDRRRPYDGRLQLGLDRLAVACARDGHKGPVGVGDLVWDWCAERPLGHWPLVFEPDVQAEGEFLVIDGAPSEFCREWVRSTQDVVADVHESSLVQHVKDVAKALGRPELYSVWRMMVTENSVLSAAQMVGRKNQFLDVPPWANWLDESYEPVPQEATVDGHVAVCRGCTQWMTPDLSGSWKCPSWRCAKRRTQAAPELRPASGAWRLRSELVLFIALPGLPELELAEALARRGARVVVYPGLDALDAVATWPNGFSIGVDVKDWRNPYLLARRIKQFPAWADDHPHAYTMGFIAVPRDRTRGKRSYLEILRKHSETLRSQSHVEAVTIDELVGRCPNLGVRGSIVCGP
ncbi:hypothetical protein [Streptomyces sp. NPDC058157]|uniref:pPIWI_RE_Y domain-containing protein n=1 Tax=Streptomyces sp. NPDC058157 TaxID=3346360 RepID=UPI0036E472A1